MTSHKLYVTLMALISGMGFRQAEAGLCDWPPAVLPWKQPLRARRTDRRAAMDRIRL